MSGCATNTSVIDACYGIDYIYISREDTLETQKQVVIHNETLQEKRINP
jgi:hypothetical protein